VKRIRWLNTQWPNSFKTLASKLKSYAFTHDGYEGFVVERVRDTSIEARYIEKLTFQESVKDPFGNVEIYDRIIYRQVAFNLYDETPSIELLDAPRSVYAYISKINEVNNFSLAITNLQVNLLTWVDVFQALINKDIIIDSLQISGLELEQGIFAKVLIHGNQDVRAALRNFTKKKQYSLEKIQFKILHDSYSNAINLTSSGTAKLTELALEEYLPLLRTSLSKSISKG